MKMSNHLNDNDSPKGLDKVKKGKANCSHHRRAFGASKPIGRKWVSFSDRTLGLSPAKEKETSGNAVDDHQDSEHGFVGKLDCSLPINIFDREGSPPKLIHQKSVPDSGSGYALDKAAGKRVPNEFTGREPDSVSFVRNPRVPNLFYHHLRQPTSTAANDTVGSYPAIITTGGSRHGSIGHATDSNSSSEYKRTSLGAVCPPSGFRRRNSETFSVGRHSSSSLQTFALQTSQPRFNSFLAAAACDTAGITDVASISGVMGASSNKVQPKKCVLTVAESDNEILIANDTACQAFGLSIDRLIGSCLNHFWKKAEQCGNTENSMMCCPSESSHVPFLVCHELFDSDGKLRKVAGSIATLVNMEHRVTKISLWAYPLYVDGDVAATTLTSDSPRKISETLFDRKTDQDRRWLLVMELVDLWMGSCVLGPKGRIFTADDNWAQIFAVPNCRQMFGAEIMKFLPKLSLEQCQWETEQASTSTDCCQQLTRLYCCGRYVDSMSSSEMSQSSPFPVDVEIRRTVDEQSGDVMKFDATAMALHSISGVVNVIADSGRIHSVNDNFARHMFGHIDTQALIGQPIEMLLPRFWENNTIRTQRKASLTRRMDLINNEDTEWALPIHDDMSPTTEIEFTTPVLVSPMVSTMKSLTLSNTDSQSATSSLLTSAASASLKAKLSAERKLSRRKSDADRLIVDGSYNDVCRHRDGMDIAVTYHVSERSAVCGGVCVVRIWIVYLHPAVYKIGVGYCSLDRKLSLEAIDAAIRRRSSDATSAQEQLKGICEVAEYEQKSEVEIPEDDIPAVDSNRDASDSLLEKEVDTIEQLTMGDYSEQYDILRDIGKGAFGYVKLTTRKRDGLLSITKFIDKRKVLSECWVEEVYESDDEDSDATAKPLSTTLPMELHLITKLVHPAIVSVLDVFENDLFYQLVMEKFGSGMDLFEFIDRQPIIDEKLVSYMFRQVVSAVYYLHGLGIVHRDLKDENVIVNQRFRCKLIDFGSAAYFGDGILFSTFCGTMEYCSPEVLTGNKYKGPEVEMWSLGVLLYTLAFFENPFQSAQQTIEGELEFPTENVSDGLHSLISWLLHPMPQFRATVKDCIKHWWLTQSVDISAYSLLSVMANAEAAEINPPEYASDLEAAAASSNPTAEAE